VKVGFFGNTNYLIISKLEVTSTSSLWAKTYENVLVDTGAWNTGIPLDDIIPPTATPPQANLKFMGAASVTGLNFNGSISMFEANLKVGEEEEYQKVQVAGLPMPLPVLGLEIIRQYKWEIDWKLRTVTAIRNP
jgi:hypothetical protein